MSHQSYDSQRKVSTSFFDLPHPPENWTCCDRGLRVVKQTIRNLWLPNPVFAWSRVSRYVKFIHDLNRGQ